jgi:V8-like Glu-specific endopeptidase
MNVRITADKNLAYKDQPSPIHSSEVKKQVPARKPTEPLLATELDMSIFLPTTGAPKLEALGRGKMKAQGGSEVVMRVANFTPGKYVFPPQTEVRTLERLGNRTANAKPLQTDAMAPAHLEVRPTGPRRLSAAMRTPPFMAAQLTRQGEKQGGNQATTIFAPDQRAVFQDTSYPWGCCGRVDSPNGFGSGVMVGPRHLLTASHMIQWGSNNTAGWVEFRPGFFDGAAPFGTAWGTLIYSKDKVSGPTIDWFEGMFDYVCVVLNWPIGNLCGWHGARGYTDSWDGTPYWDHIGYPGDLTGGNRPTFQNAISLDGVWWEFDSDEAMSHHADVWPGQSGGPFFAWWAGDVGPSAVAVQSSQNSSENNASGGQDLVDLILQARSDHP